MASPACSALATTARSEKSKLRIPDVRPGSIRRASLIDRLAREVSCPVVSVVAPAGYGKTTLLAQWAERSGQAVAWVSVDEQDNDPNALLGAVARALDAVQPVARPVFDALASPASSRCLRRSRPGHRTRV